MNLGECPREKTDRPGSRGTRRERISLSPLAEVGRVPEALDGAMVAAGYPDRGRFAVRLAAEETVVNAVRHGHRGDPGKAVRVCFRVGRRQVVVRVEDQGPSAPELAAAGALPEPSGGAAAWGRPCAVSPPPLGGSAVRRRLTPGGWHDESPGSRLVPPALRAACTPRHRNCKRSGQTATSPCRRPDAFPGLAVGSELKGGGT